MSTLRWFGWSPIIAMSWLGSLAAFLSIHVMFAAGWAGLAAFAVPYVVGVIGFGWLLGDPQRNPVAIFEAIQTRYAGLLLTTQILVIAATTLWASSHVFVPLCGRNGLAVVALIMLLAAAVGHAASLETLSRLHIVCAAATLATIAVLLLGLQNPVPAALSPAQTASAPLQELFVPALVGMLLGPWSDARQWQLATTLHRAHISIRGVYAGAASIIALVLAFVGLLAAMGASRIRQADAAVSAGVETLVTDQIVASPPWLAATAMACAGIAIAATVATSYNATRWLLKATTSQSTSPLLAFIPAGIATSPLWFLVGGILVAAAALVSGVPVFYIVIPFATVLAGPTACILCESVGGKPSYDGVLCAMIGLAALLFFVIGVFGDLPLFISIAPAIGLIGALPAFQSLRERPKNEAPGPRASQNVVATPLQTIEMAPDERFVAHGFDGHWFVLHITPTYDDTNSVGNVYFANYFRWVGKTRELFFNACMPDFDLRSANFLVLTKSFTHEFRREMREFQPVSVRVRIGSYNRKFVTITHEILSRTEGLVGRGEQTIMFVDTAHYRPIDIPAIILQRFLPYYTPNPSGPKARTPVEAQPAPAS